MRIAFYAPMKPPDHPLPSGDRTMARLLAAALAAGGHRVEIASRHVSWDGTGDTGRQRRLRAIGEQTADRLLEDWCALPADHWPELWFTYHLYHKAPDWLGPRIARGLGIPYVVAEASHAGKQADGAWAEGHAAAAAAIAAADRVVCLNVADVEGVLDLVAAPSRIAMLPPFVDAEPFRRAQAQRATLRSRLCAAHGLDPAEPLLLAIAMMRPGDKLASWRLLARTLGRLGERPWRLLAVGDGPARPAVEEAFAPLAARVIRLGEVDAETIPTLCAAADLFVWPAIGEAWGMALVEAQAAGLPVVAGQAGGVGDVVADGETGELVPVGDAAALAGAIARMLDAPDRRRAMGRAAASRIAARHDLPVAARRLDADLRGLVPPREVAI